MAYNKCDLFAEAVKEAQHRLYGYKKSQLMKVYAFFKYDTSCDT